jgi:hypothetical protein
MEVPTFAFDPDQPHGPQRAALAAAFLGRRVTVRVGEGIDTAAGRRKFKRTLTLTVTDVSIGADGVFLRYGHGNRGGWFTLYTVVAVEAERQWPQLGPRLRLSALAC